MAMIIYNGENFVRQLHFFFVKSWACVYVGFSIFNKFYFVCN